MVMVINNVTIINSTKLHIKMFILLYFICLLPQLKTKEKNVCDIWHKVDGTCKHHVIQPIHKCPNAV